MSMPNELPSLMMINLFFTFNIFIFVLWCICRLPEGSAAHCYARSRKHVVCEVSPSHR